jgi:hypothetical protein
MPQKPLGGLLVNERGKATTFRPSPGVQLDHMMAVINSPLKRWRVPHFSNRHPLNPQATKQKFTGPKSQQIVCEVFDVSDSTFRTRLSRDQIIAHLLSSSPPWLFHTMHRSRRGVTNVSKQKADSLQATAQSFSEEEIVEIPWHRGIPITRPQHRAELNIWSSNFVSGLKWIPS